MAKARAPQVNPAKTALLERNGYLRDRLEMAALRSQNSAMECIVGDQAYQYRLAEADARDFASGSGRVLTPEYFAREAGWGADMGLGMSADPGDRYQGANRPVFATEADLASIRAIGRFYTEFDEVGLGLRENVVNYNTGEAIAYKAEAREEGPGEAVADALQKWIDLFLEQNRWVGLREKEPMRVSFSDGEAALLLGFRSDLEYPEIRISDCSHITDPQNLAPYQTQRLGVDWLDWTFGIGTPVGRPDLPQGYFFDWYGKDDYQLFPASRVVHAKFNVTEDVKRGVNDLYVAHTSLKRAAVGTGATAQQGVAQAGIAYIEEMAENTPVEKVQQTLNTPGLISDFVNSLGGASRSVKRQGFMGGEIITTADKRFKYGPVGTPAGKVLMEIFKDVLRRVAVRWQFPDFMVTGDPSNNNMASSVVAETPFHRSTRTRQGVWADYYEQLIRKAVELAISVGRGPEGVPGDPRELWRLVKIRCKMPDPKERDQLEETTILEIQHRNRVISVKSWREEVGLDHETEEANFAEEDAASVKRMEAETQATGGFDDPMGGSDPTTPNRARVVQKRADKKARAAEALSNPQAFLEVARGAGWDDQTRRAVAAGVMFDRTDDN